MALPHQMNVKNAKKFILVNLLSLSAELAGAFFVRRRVPYAPVPLTRRRRRLILQKVQ
jgi:hypothetical protein